MCDILEMFSYHRFEHQQQPYYPTKRVHTDLTRGSPRLPKQLRQGTIQELMKCDTFPNCQSMIHLTIVFEHCGHAGSS